MFKFKDRLSLQEGIEEGEGQTNNQTSNTNNFEQSNSNNSIRNLIKLFPEVSDLKLSNFVDQTLNYKGFTE